MTSKNATEETTGMSFTMLFNDGVNYDPVKPMKQHTPSWHKEGVWLFFFQEGVYVCLFLPPPCLSPSSAIAVLVYLIFFCVFTIGIAGMVQGVRQLAMYAGWH